MFKRIILPILALILMAGFLTACSSKPYTDACALVVGAGVGDVRTVKEVIHPGQKFSVKGDDEAFYLPCNARNFLIQPNGKGDRAEPAQVTTGLGDSAVGLPVRVWPSMYWQLNQDDEVLKEFYPFCRKYQCAGRAEDGDDQNQNNATAGWNDLLQENHGPVIDRAFSRAIQEFDPDIWIDRAKWPELAKKASEYFWQEMAVNTGTQTRFFCGTWSPTNERQTKGKCSPVTFTINDIQPSDPEVAKKYRQGITAQQDSENRIADLARRKQEVAAQAELANEQARLLSIPGYREQLNQQRQLDLIAACGAAQLKVCGSGGAGVLINGG